MIGGVTFSEFLDRFETDPRAAFRVADAVSRAAVGAPQAERNVTVRPTISRDNWTPAMWWVNPHPEE